MRRQCRDPVFIAARGLLTGEVSTIPQRCEALASAARDEVTRYAGTHIDSLSPQVEEILAYLALGNPVSGGLNSGALGAPLPGMTGLAPDARQMREDECMLRGGAQENCRAVLAQGSPSSNADCTRAETHWKSAEDIKTLAAYEDHLARFASCEFANLAKTRIERLKK
jgi:hypothetical protein